VPARSSRFTRPAAPFFVFLIQPALFVFLALGAAVTARATLFAQADTLGAPRWMAQERMSGPRTADAAVMERTLLALVERVKPLAVAGGVSGSHADLRGRGRGPATSGHRDARLLAATPDEGSGYLYTNKDVVESLEWRAIASTMLK
jgi:hypothetical protein